MRYGISFISTEQAKKNLQREITAYDVDVVAKAGRNEWNKSLSKIKVSGGTDDEKTVTQLPVYGDPRAIFGDPTADSRQLVPGFKITT